MSNTKEVESFLEYYSKRGICLPSPEHYPLQFAYYVRLYRYNVERNKNAS
jgi:hypothetical protein